jgi:hypothetical protein
MDWCGAKHNVVSITTESASTSGLHQVAMIRAQPVGARGEIDFTFQG